MRLKWGFEYTFRYIGFVRNRWFRVKMGKISKVMSGNFKWTDVDHFFTCQVGEIIDQSREDLDVDDDSYRGLRESVKRLIGDDTYSVTRTKEGDSEGESYSEYWFKNGQYHRLGGQPAHIERTGNSSDFDDSGHHTECTKKYYVNGQPIKQEVIQDWVEPLPERTLEADEPTL